MDGTAVFFLLVRRPDGSPTGYPMTGFFRDGAVEFTTYRRSAKARYLLDDDRVCCVVPDESGAGGVALWGHAVPTDPAGFTVGGQVDGPMVVPDAVVDSVRQALDAGRRMVFRVDIERSAPVGIGRRHP
jgi:hypothetical protein